MLATKKYAKIINADTINADKSLVPYKRIHTNPKSFAKLNQGRYKRLT